MAAANTVPIDESNSRKPSAHSAACAAPSTSATRCGGAEQSSRRWVVWSRPPESTGAPRRTRETTTSVVSSTIRPTNGTTAKTAAVPKPSVDGIAVSIAASRNPIGMLPPSPRKTRAGRARLKRRNAETGARETEREGRERSLALRGREHTDARGGHAADCAGGAVEVVHQVERVDEPDDPAVVSARLIRALVEERPAQAGLPERVGGRRARRTRASAGRDATRSSSVPTAQSPSAASKRHEVVGAAAAEQQRHRREGRHHAEPTEVRRGRPCFL